MNAWGAAAVTLLVVTVPVCLWVAGRGSAVRRLAGTSLLSTVVGAVFLLLPEAYGRSSYQDLALVLAILAPAGTLVFTRFVAGQEQDTQAPADGAGE